METSYDFNKHTILMHKFLKDFDLKEDMHVFLSGIIGRSFDERYQEVVHPFVAHDYGDLMMRVGSGKHDIYPNYYPYLVSFHTGEFHTILSSKAYDTKPVQMPLIFTSYNLASEYGYRMGKGYVASILERLNMRLEDYMKMMGKFFRFLDENPEIKITKEDYENFKKHLKSKQQKITFTKPKISDDSGGLII